MLFINRKTVCQNFDLFWVWKRLRIVLDDCPRSKPTSEYAWRVVQMHGVQCAGEYFPSDFHLIILIFKFSSYVFFPSSLCVLLLFVFSSNDSRPFQIVDFFFFLYVAENMAYCLQLIWAWIWIQEISKHVWVWVRIHQFGYWYGPTSSHPKLDPNPFPSPQKIMTLQFAIGTLD